MSGTHGRCKHLLSATSTRPVRWQRRVVCSLLLIIRPLSHVSTTSLRATQSCSSGSRLSALPNAFQASSALILLSIPPTARHTLLSATRAHHQISRTFITTGRSAPSSSIPTRSVAPSSHCLPWLRLIGFSPRCGLPSPSQGSSFRCHSVSGVYCARFFSRKMHILIRLIHCLFWRYSLSIYQRFLCATFLRGTSGLRLTRASASLRRRTVIRADCAALPGSHCDHMS
mmetsp:Transcript_21496/g.35465  ORF Transcript_21496/g.35465 Transcript_21496/m.35465 type:complete len:228 (-) Transcript_21496:208-891(-)